MYVTHVMYVVYVMYILTYLSMCIYIYTWLLSSTGDCAFASFSLVPQQTISGWENSAENGGFRRKKNIGKYGKI
jgi:hypothetical protein